MIDHSSQAAAGSMAVASTAGCVCWGSALQVSLSPTIGSAGVIPGVLIPFILQRTGEDIDSISADELIEKVGDKALLDFFAGSTIGLAITKLQSSHAAASHGCMGEVGNSAIAGVMAYLNAMMTEPENRDDMTTVRIMESTEVDSHEKKNLMRGHNFEKINKILIAAQHVMHFYDGLTCTPAVGRVGSPCNVRNEQSFIPILTAALVVLSSDTPKSFESFQHIAGLFDQAASEQDIIGRSMSAALRETDQEKVMQGTGDGMVLDRVLDIEDIGAKQHTLENFAFNEQLMNELNASFLSQAKNTVPLNQTFA